MNDEMTNIIAYRPKSLKSHFSVQYLLELEQRIIASMIASKNDYEYIRSLCHEDDFTFIDHKTLFNYLRVGDHYDIWEIRTSNNAKMALMEIFKEVSSSVCIETMIKAIESDLSEDIECDIAELLAYSNEKVIAQEAFDEDEEISKIYIRIIKKQGDFTALYQRDRLCEIWITNYKGFPSEFCDTYMETFKALIPLLEDTENNPSSLIEGETSAFDSMHVIIEQDIKSIEAIGRLIQWGYDNNLSDDIFPKTKVALSNHPLWELENLGLTELPEEMGILKIGGLILKGNQLTTLPESFKIQSSLLLLSLCNNHFEEVPEWICKLPMLSLLCFHGNHLSMIPEAIANLKFLTTLSVSNNPLTTLPDSIGALKSLTELHIENTLMDTMPESIFELKTLKKISFDDKHLPFLMQNKEFFSQFEIINLAHSEYRENQELIKECALEIDYEEWMKPNDYQGHGCIVLNRAVEVTE